MSTIQVISTVSIMVIGLIPYIHRLQNKDWSPDTHTVLITVVCFPTNSPFWIILHHLGQLMLQYNVNVYYSHKVWYSCWYSCPWPGIWCCRCTEVTVTLTLSLAGYPVEAYIINQRGKCIGLIIEYCLEHCSTQVEFNLNIFSNWYINWCIKSLL